MALCDFPCVCLSSSLAAFGILFNFCHLNYDMSWCGSVRVHLLGFLYLNMFPSLGLGIFQNLFKSSSNTFSISISLNGNPLQYSCLENPMDGGAWCRLLPMGLQSRTRLSDFTFTFHFHALEEMSTRSSVLAWRIPGMVGPGGLPSMGSQSRT